MKRSCILLMSDNPRLAAAADAIARELFDVRHASRYPRSARKLESEVVEIALAQRVEFLFSFLSPIIVPPAVLDSIGTAAINFHPAPPKWPGVGSASLALFHGDETFGATAHLMTPQVDAGAILRVNRFPILEGDDCESLFGRAMDASLDLFHDVLRGAAQHHEITFSGETWERHAVTRAEFERWMRVSVDDAEDEIQRKALALKHSHFPGPYVELAGMRFHVLPGTPVAAPRRHPARELAA